MLWKPGGRGYVRPSCMTRTEEDKPELTPEEELALMTKQVNASDVCVVPLITFGLFYLFMILITNHFSGV